MIVCFLDFYEVFVVAVLVEHYEVLMSKAVFVKVSLTSLEDKTCWWAAIKFMHFMVQGAVT
jgi:hypothetical protein